MRATRPESSDSGGVAHRLDPWWGCRQWARPSNTGLVVWLQWGGCQWRQWEGSSDSGGVTRHLTPVSGRQWRQ